MDTLMNALHTKLQPLLQRRWFEMVKSLTIFANPIAILPQVWAAFTAQSVEGIIIPMWCIFAAIQLALVFEGIKTRSASVFLSVLVCFLESATIVVVAMIRR